MELHNEALEEICFFAARALKFTGELRQHPEKARRKGLSGNFLLQGRVAPWRLKANSGSESYQKGVLGKRLNFQDSTFHL